MARTDQPHKLTFETFVAKASDLSNPINEKHRDVDYSRPESAAAWNGSKSKVPLWCNVHREFFVQQAANHMNGQGCPKCGMDTYKAKRRKADPVADFRAKHGDTYDYSKMHFTNVQTPIEIVCQRHGSFMQKPNNHLRGDGCPVCWEERRQNFGAERNVDFKATFAARAAAIHKGAYEIIKHPEGSHDTVILRCATHGEFEQKAFSHLAGHGCWSCGQNTNFAELELAEFVKSLGVEIEHENRTVLDGLHIDIWIPSKRLGIEYHGSFWHTEARIGRKHREKYERAVAAGIRLIQVFDFEWLERRTAVENRLRALIATEGAIGARECEVREVTRSEASKFFKRVHTQGNASKSVVIYGLYKYDALIAAMSFCMNRYGKEGWELLRYASCGRVQGGFSRLLSKFRETHHPDVLTSYCDLRWGDGSVYRQAGFELERVTAPDYWYVDKRGANRISRFTVQGRPKGISERDYVKSIDYHKVLGVGHQVWVWRPESAVGDLV